MVSAQASGRSLTGLLSRGLGRFGLAPAAPPRPSAGRLLGFDAVLLFVVGGVSLGEIREVRVWATPIAGCQLLFTVF